MQKKLPLRRRIYTGAMRTLMYLSAGLTAALVLFLIGYVLLTLFAIACIRKSARADGAPAAVTLH